MTGTGVIDQFLETFTRYIDNGFGLLGGDVGYLATTLAAIDITLAALFWSWGTDEDIIARLVKKTLFVGVFADLIGKTAFADERVLGNVISSGIKVLVLAVIVGIGSTLFSQFTSGFGGAQPTIEDAMTLVLAALALLGLGIFGPGIANGIV